MRTGWGDSRGRGSPREPPEGTTPRVLPLARAKNERSVSATETIPRKTHRLVLAGVPERRLIAPVLRTGLARFALGCDRERVIEVREVRDHPLRRVRRLPIGLRRIVCAVVDGEPVARALERADIQERRERAD